MAKPLKYPTKLLIGLTDEQLAAIDAWRREQADLPSRSEAIRRLVDVALGAH
jgi:metal-responsive CopG/Arc/MetJ family transcriptional regulator